MRARLLVVWGGLYRRLRSPARDQCYPASLIVYRRTCQRLVSAAFSSIPRPAAALVGAALAVPADDRVEGPGLDGAEDLRDQPEEAKVGGTVAGGPVAVELELPGLGQDVEAEVSCRPREG